MGLSLLIRGPDEVWLYQKNTKAIQLLLCLRVFLLLVGGSSHLVSGFVHHSFK